MYSSFLNRESTVSCFGANMCSTFSDLSLPPWICGQMEKLGLKEPTPIQKQCVPPIMDGKDCIGAAKTGSGKTFAFALPILAKLSEDPANFFALVLTPTHELAYQISEQFNVAGQSMGCRVCVVAGGTDQMYESQRLMKRPHIVVAMPGRLADHLSGCNTFSFRALKFLVIDEADRMLNGNFDESLATIGKHLPKTRQNLFFSATLKDCVKSNTVMPIAEDAFEWSEDSTIATVETLDQRYILCADYDRDMVMIEALRNYKEENENANVIIFTNTKKDCQLLSMTLNDIGYKNVCLHGYMKQRERVSALNQFKSNYVRVLIATDVASRGLDIPNVQLVLNHRLPKFPHEYIHRVGRTARAGRDGLAISIFRFPRDLEFLGRIEAAINTKLTEMVIDQRMVERIFMQVSVTKREAEIKLDNKDFDERAVSYRRKKWIEDGLDPDAMERQIKREKDDRIKERIQNAKARRKAAEETDKEQAAKFNKDDRFKGVQLKAINKKSKLQQQKLKKLNTKKKVKK